jgi:D-alanine-D-alanine ligase
MNTRNRRVYLIVVQEEHARKDMLEIIVRANVVARILRKKGLPVKILPIKKKDFGCRGTIARRIYAHNPRCIINFFEGFHYDSQKEVTFARILERLGIPFTGNSSVTLGLCLNKQRVRQFLMRHALPVPCGILVKRTADLKRLLQLKFPLFVKPCSEDASIGIDRCSFVKNIENLKRSIHKKLGKSKGGLVVEEFIDGKEYCVGFLGNKHPYTLLGISCLDYAQHPKSLPFLSYSSKWRKEDYDFKELNPSPADDLSLSARKKLLAIASKAAMVTACRGYFRIDLRAKNGTFFVLDINPNPDIGLDSGFDHQVYHSGYTYAEVIGKIISLSKAGAGV